MAPHSSTLAWKIPWTEEPGGLLSMGSLRVGHDWATSLWLFTFMCWRRKWQPTPVFLPGESQGRGSLVGCVCGVTRSQTLVWSDLTATVATTNDAEHLFTRLFINGWFEVSGDFNIWASSGTIPIICYLLSYSKGHVFLFLGTRVDFWLKIGASK